MILERTDLKKRQEKLPKQKYNKKKRNEKKNLIEHPRAVEQYAKDKKERKAQKNIFEEIKDKHFPN